MIAYMSLFFAISASLYIACLTAKQSSKQSASSPASSPASSQQAKCQRNRRTLSLAFAMIVIISMPLWREGMERILWILW